uniref:Uncharacterized protein n=1 Tax=Arundo donax TaxID=35708 RepID=A0A0A8YAH9_ARUDO
MDRNPLTVCFCSSLSLLSPS